MIRTGVWASVSLNGGVIDLDGVTAPDLFPQGNVITRRPYDSGACF